MIQPRNIEMLGETAPVYFSALSSYTAPWLEEKLNMDGKFPMERFSECFDEIKKYISIAKFTDKPLAMTSDTIDEVWHQFILFTREYTDFSKQFYGRYFHHSPNIPSRQGNSESLDNLIKGYNKMYGPMPAIWNICKCQQQ